MSDSDMSETKLPVRMSIKFSRLLRTQSNLIYPDPKDKRESASRMLIMAAIEKISSKTHVSKEWLKSIV